MRNLKVVVYERRDLDDSGFSLKFWIPMTDFEIETLLDRLKEVGDIMTDDYYRCGEIRYVWFMCHLRSIDLEIYNPDDISIRDEYIDDDHIRLDFFKDGRLVGQENKLIDESANGRRWEFVTIQLA